MKHNRFNYISGLCKKKIRYALFKHGINLIAIKEKIKRINPTINPY